MATKTDFTPEEWKAILGSPMLAGMAVTLAEPSGIFGMLKESLASGRALLDAKADASASGIAPSLANRRRESCGVPCRASRTGTGPPAFLHASRKDTLCRGLRPPGRPARHRGPWRSPPRLGRDDRADRAPRDRGNRAAPVIAFLG